MIVILGPTATGKTALATSLASQINGEIISADSRQVFRTMDIGTGKDLSEYWVNGQFVPYHLIDIVEPGTEFSMFDFQSHFYHAYNDIISRDKFPILCGGTGLYLESVINAYPMVKVAVNHELREQLKDESMDHLSERLAKYRKLHNQTDTEDRERVLRALEIEIFYHENPDLVEKSKQVIHPINVYGIYFDRDVIRNRITQRLKERLGGGMIEEVEMLLDSGTSYDCLQRYGLEYKYVSQYLKGLIDYQTLFNALNIAIHQFAKRQSSWFRRMEKNGVIIHWIDGNESIVNKMKIIANSALL